MKPKENSIVPEITRLHQTQASVDVAINNYRAAGGPEQFFVYPLISGRVGDAASLLNSKEFFFYLLPCSIADEFKNVPGEYSLDEEKVIVIKELRKRTGDIVLEKVCFIIKSDGKSYLQISAMKPLHFIPTARTGLPFVGKLAPLGTRLIK